MSFAETILPASLVNSLTDIKILSVKILMVLKLLEILSSNFYDFISYVNIDTKPGNFLAWGLNRFVGIWYENGCC